MFVEKCVVCGKRPPGRRQYWPSITCSEVCRKARRREAAAKSRAKHSVRIREDRRKKAAANPLEHARELKAKREAARERYATDPEYRERKKELARQHRAQFRQGPPRTSKEPLPLANYVNAVRNARVNAGLSLEPGILGPRPEPSPDPEIAMVQAAKAELGLYEG